MPSAAPKSANDASIAKQYQRYLEVEAQAQKLWEKKDRELRKLARLAGLGRKARITVPISENRGIRITNQFRTKEDKLFTPAFCRRLQLKEIPLDSAD